MPHLILIEGSPGLVCPQLGAEPEGAVLGDVDSGGGVGQGGLLPPGVPQLASAEVVVSFALGALDQHTLAPGHLHHQQGNPVNCQIKDSLM